MIVIVGGGITGLSAAFELATRGVPFVLLESSPRLGGLILTEHIAGFTLDGGPDSLLAQKPAALTLCEELGLGPQLMSTSPPRTSFVLKRGRLHRLPSPSVLGIPTTMTALARYDLLPWTARARLALERWAPRGSRPDESVASFFRRRFGASTVDLVAEPLLGGIHAGDIEQLSVASLFPRLVDAERKPGKVLKNLSPSPQAGGLFRALRGGMLDLVRAIADRLPEGAIRLNSPVTALRRAGRGWEVDVGSDTRRAESVIVAAPAHAAAALFDPIDREAATICRQVLYVSTASIALGYRRADILHPLDGSGFVVARRHNAMRLTACTWVSSKWESRAPRDHALIRAFTGSVHDQAVVDLSDDGLIELAVRDLSPILTIRAAPLVARVFRWRNAAAQHTVHHRERMGALSARLAAQPGLFVTGSGFDSIGIPDCVGNARRVAGAAADYVRIKV